MSQKVAIRTHTVGQSFATGAHLIDAHTGARLLDITEVFPLGFASRAIETAARIADGLGLTVVESEIL